MDADCGGDRYVWTASDGQTYSVAWDLLPALLAEVRRARQRAAAVDGGPRWQLEEIADDLIAAVAEIVASAEPVTPGVYNPHDE